MIYINDELIGILNQYKTEGFYNITTDIPEKKFQMAMKLYPIQADDQLIALIDSTLLGSAKTGLIISLNGLTWKNNWTTATAKNTLSWDELKDITVTKKGYNVNFENDCLFDTAKATINQDILINIINALINLYHSDSRLPNQSSSTNQDNEEVDYRYFETFISTLYYCLRGDKENLTKEEFTLHSNSILYPVKKFVPNDTFEYFETFYDNLISNLDHLNNQSKGLYNLKRKEIIQSVVEINNITKILNILEILDHIINALSLDSNSCSVKMKLEIEEALSNL